ncbi:MAG: hypothetical protein GXP05_09690 [Alphaproteobacteria bacterium]|nr:hypothetical protein [Alphaproteobacteria bacterium]
MSPPQPRSHALKPAAPMEYLRTSPKANLRCNCARNKTSGPGRPVARRYDSPDTLFYLDPPYWGGETDYGKGMFDRGNFARMADVLANISGRFILSINDRVEIRELFGRFPIEPVRLKYSVASGAGTDAREMIVTDREVVVGLF